MRRMVITNRLGEYIAEREVDEGQLDDEVRTWIGGLPGAAGIYIDGELVAAAPPSMSVPELPVHAFSEPPTPEALRTFADVLHQSFHDIRKGYVDSLNDLHDTARRFSDMWIERERQMADEAARQRAMTHKSLQDADLLGRSVVAVKFKESVASASAHNAARAQRGDRDDRGDRMRFTDLFAGFIRTITGAQQ